MLRLYAIVLGAMLLLAGCTSPQESSEPVPEEDCLLGGPPRAPPEDRSTFNLTDDHLDQHPNLTRVFTDPAHIVVVSCQAGLSLMEHLASEGADIGEGTKTYDRNVFLAHNATALWVSLHAQR